MVTHVADRANIYIHHINHMRTHLITHAHRWRYYVCLTLLYYTFNERLCFICWMTAVKGSSFALQSTGVVKYSIYARRMCKHIILYIELRTLSAWLHFAPNNIWWFDLIVRLLTRFYGGAFAFW